MVSLADNHLRALYDSTYKQLITQAAVYGLSPAVLDKYFRSAPEYNALLGVDMSMVLERLLFTLQNRQRFSRTIRFQEHKEETKKLLYDFDVKKIADDYKSDHAVERLHTKLCPVFKWDVNARTPMLWCEGLIQGAQQLAKFQNSTDLVSKIRNFKGTEMVHYWMKHYPIKGMGFALTCDFLKEIGFDLAKPDVHIKGVLDSVFNLSENTLEDEEYLTLFMNIVNSLKKIKDPNLSAYKLDKMIWLVCTNDFYLDRCEKNLRQNLIEKINDVLFNISTVW